MKTKKGIKLLTGLAKEIELRFGSIPQTEVKPGNTYYLYEDYVDNYSRVPVKCISSDLDHVDQHDRIIKFVLLADDYKGIYTKGESFTTSIFPDWFVRKMA